MLDYYQLLEIPTDAGNETIKKAFRKRAKEIHPDLWDQSPEALASMRDLLKAYETLMDNELREHYDIQHRKVYGLKSFDYREFLLGRTADNESQSKLIFFDLLHNREKDALRLYETLVQKKQFDLSAHMDREDFMDCAFLLAEEFEAEGNYSSAYHLLRTIVQYELQKPYFKHFFEEVIHRLHHLLGVKMFGKVSSREHLTYIHQVISFNISPKETAFYFRIAAEIYVNLKDFPRAKNCLKEGLKLDNSLTGVKKIREKITRAC